jgi:hypothetical protein
VTNIISDIKMTTPPTDAQWAVMSKAIQSISNRPDAGGLNKMSITIDFPCDISKVSYSLPFSEPFRIPVAWKALGKCHPMFENFR